jgi:transcriptional regulator with XRE-family HTH domain
MDEPDHDKRNLCGGSIKAVRQAKGLTLYDVETELRQDYRIKLDRSAIGRIENGNQAIHDYELAAIARILGVPVLDLLDGPGAITLEDFVTARPLVEEGVDA